MPDIKLCFDVAQGLPFAIPQNTFCITHGHLDHAAGIPYIISQKCMLSHAPARFLMPRSLVEPLEEIMSLWQKIENHTYKYELIGVDENSVIQLNDEYSIRPFPTVHRVDSLGYTVFRTTQRLKPEYAGLEPGEIARMRKNGTILTAPHAENLVSFTGDTQIEFLERSPQPSESKILIMESTYIDNIKSVEHARTWGHTHIEEIIPYLTKIKSEKIVLIHTSSRYRDADLEKLLERSLPESQKNRVVLFPGR